MPSGMKKITAMRTAAKKKGTYALKARVASGRMVRTNAPTMGPEKVSAPPTVM